MLPALDILSYYCSSTLITEMDCYMGICYNSTMIWTNLNGLYHRRNNPAYISRINYPGLYHIFEEKWYLQGELHNYNYPAWVIYKCHDNVLPGNYFLVNSKCNYSKITEEWYKNGKSHRCEGPVIITYDSKGQIDGQYWYYLGE